MARRCATSVAYFQGHNRNRARGHPTCVSADTRRGQHEAVTAAAGGTRDGEAKSRVTDFREGRGDEAQARGCFGNSEHVTRSCIHNESHRFSRRTRRRRSAETRLFRQTWNRESETSRTSGNHPDWRERAQPRKRRHKAVSAAMSKQLFNCVRTQKSRSL